jgi:prenyl protein peptidase
MLRPRPALCALVLCSLAVTFLSPGPLSFTLLYVTSLYLRDALGLKPLPRDHRDVVLSRFASVLTVTVLASLLAPTVPARAATARAETARALGVVGACFFAGVLVVVLFVAPIAAMLVESVGGGGGGDGGMAGPDLLLTVRNLVVAPVSEEVVFRGCVVSSMFVATGATPAQLILLSPLYFSLAHVHHGVSLYVAGQPARTAVFVSLFQAFYTYLFGVFAAFLLVRTGHLPAPVLAHSLCNFFGFPDFELLWNHPSHKTTMRGLLVGGLVGFIALLAPLTEPTLFQSPYYF